MDFWKQEVQLQPQACFLEESITRQYYIMSNICDMMQAYMIYSILLYITTAQISLNKIIPENVISSKLCQR